MGPPRTPFYPLERQALTSPHRKAGSLPFPGGVMPRELADTAPEGREGHHAREQRTHYPLVYLQLLTVGLTIRGACEGIFFHAPAELLPRPVCDR